MANEIWIDDIIGEGFYSAGVTAKRVREDLAKFKDTDRVLVRINSPGGDAFEGIAILTMLQQHKGGVDCQVDGLAASAASLIATVGETVTIADGGFIMIHCAWTVAAGNSVELAKAADMLGKLDTKLADAYARKSGKGQTDILEKMADETWFDSDEAIAFGLADEKVEQVAKAFAIPKEFDYKHAPAGTVQDGQQKPPLDGRNVGSIAAMRRKIDLARAVTRR